MINSVGFTGTQAGMTDEQSVLVAELLRRMNPKETHSGDCIGADHDFLTLVKITCPEAVTCGHPPIKKDKACGDVYRIVFSAKEYLERNKDIVDTSNVMIACPKGFNEELRSGTWSTVRYAERRGVMTIIVYPDGSIESRLGLPDYLKDLGCPFPKKP
jgi:hypothetical protein